MSSHSLTAPYSALTAATVALGSPPTAAQADEAIRATSSPACLVEARAAATATGDLPAGQASDCIRARHSAPDAGTIDQRKFATVRSSSSSIQAAGPDTFKIESVLGRGSFGEVYRVTHKVTGEEFAMKVLKKKQVFDKNLLRYTMTERNLLSYLKHPFIVSLHYAFQTSTTLVLVLQFCPNGDLSSLVKRQGRLPEALSKFYLAEMFLAIEHLHARQVVYRDLKPENVVLDDGSHAMLTDFGLSKESVQGLDGAKSFCGSVAYLAPEVLARDGHGTPLDIYGLGVLLFEMISGRPPFYVKERRQLFANIARATLQAPSAASPPCAAFILDTMRRKPADRLGARDTSELRGHAFLADVDFVRLLLRDLPVPPSTLVLPTAKATGASYPQSYGVEASPNTHVRSPFVGKWSPKAWGAKKVEGWEFVTADTPILESTPDCEEIRRRWRASLCMQRVFRCSRMQPAVAPKVVAAGQGE